MAARMKDTATPADEMLLDSIAKDQAARMSEQAANTTYEPAPPKPPTQDKAPAPEEGVFESETPSPPARGQIIEEGAFESETPSPPARGQIIMDLPINISSVEIRDSDPTPTVHEDSYTPVTDTPGEEDIIEPPPEESSPTSDKTDIEQRATTLAEEILSQQMQDESQLQSPVSFVSSLADSGLEEHPPPREEQQGKFDDSPASKDEEQQQDAIEDIVEALNHPPVKPARAKVAIGAIRPPEQTSRTQSILIQVLIVFLSLAAAAMIAYLTGILNL